MLTRKDIKQIAEWNGFTCTIDKEYDPDARGHRKSYDRVYITWEGAEYRYAVDWFYSIQFSCKTINDVLELFKRVKQESEVNAS